MLTRFILAATLIALSAGFAAAAPAVTTDRVALREGPGITFPVIAVIPPGHRVEVAGCARGWCEVAWRGYDGFARRAYLRFIGILPPAYMPHPGYRVRPYFRRDRYYRGRIIRRVEPRYWRERRPWVRGEPRPRLRAWPGPQPYVRGPGVTPRIIPRGEPRRFIAPRIDVPRRVVPAPSQVRPFVAPRVDRLAPAFRPPPVQIRPPAVQVRPPPAPRSVTPPDRRRLLKPN